MNRLILLVFISFLSLAICLPTESSTTSIEDELKIEKEEQERAAAAKYHFASDVQDGISDLTQQREEVRDGLNVKGYYSYSDGHFKRKVTYEADEKGYRIVRQEVEPLEGPHVNPEGRASIHTKAHGNEVSYAVVGDDKTRRRRLYEKFLEEENRDAKGETNLDKKKDTSVLVQ